MEFWNTQAKTGVPDHPVVRSLTSLGMTAERAERAGTFAVFLRNPRSGIYSLK
jgi:hypothetical protein